MGGGWQGGSAVNVDNVTLEMNVNGQLQIKDGGVSQAKLAAALAFAKIVGLDNVQRSMTGSLAAMSSFTGLTVTPTKMYRVTIFWETASNEVTYFQVRLSNGATNSDFAEFFVADNSAGGNRGIIVLYIAQLNSATPTQAQMRGYAKSTNSTSDIPLQTILANITLGGSLNYADQTQIIVRARSTGSGAKQNFCVVEELTT